MPGLPPFKLPWFKAAEAADPAPSATNAFATEQYVADHAGEGPPGADGASAYEVAVANGFVGTEAEWLASLVGADGADGADGAPGPDDVLDGKTVNAASPAADDYLAFVGGEWTNKTLAYLQGKLQALTGWSFANPVGFANGTAAAVGAWFRSAGNGIYSRVTNELNFAVNAVESLRISTAAVFTWLPLWIVRQLILNPKVIDLGGGDYTVTSSDGPMLILTDSSGGFPGNLSLPLTNGATYLIFNTDYGTSLSVLTMGVVLGPREAMLVAYQTNTGQYIIYGRYTN